MKLIKTRKTADNSIKIDLFSNLLNSALFVGYVPVASGTFGSMFALIFILIPGFDNIFIIAALTAVCFLLCLLTARKILKKFGDDPSVLVIDEVIGMWIALIILKLLNGYSEQLGLKEVIISFIAFRFFDIVKLQPAGYFDGMKNVFGVLMDDIIAGIYAGTISYLIIVLIKLL
ncbi:MAG: phosphatidylglycerophosphatase A [Ignavibacteria bacterium]|nr:phosphatidylglycerophosphatase A [Ignavibacteria bacterium]